jgi:hypothetical protein
MKVRCLLRLEITEPVRIGLAGQVMEAAEADPVRRITMYDCHRSIVVRALYFDDCFEKRSKIGKPSLLPPHAP